MKCKKSFRTLFLGVLLTVSILPVIIIFLFYNLTLYPNSLNLNNLSDIAYT